VTCSSRKWSKISIVPPNRRDQNFLGVRGSIGHKNEALLEKGLRKGVLEKK